MKKAFTLIELLIVLLILSLVIGLVAPKGIKIYNSFINKLNKKEAKTKIVKIQFECFIKDETNKTLNINKNGIINEKKFYNN